MKIILKEDITNLGYKDDVVEVKSGYGRNYLIPQGKAVIATPSALKVLAENQRQRAHKLAKIKADAEAIAAAKAVDMSKWLPKFARNLKNAIKAYEEFDKETATQADVDALTQLINDTLSNYIERVEIDELVHGQVDLRVGRDDVDRAFGVEVAADRHFRGGSQSLDVDDAGAERLLKGGVEMDRGLL